MSQIRVSSLTNLRVEHTNAFDVAEPIPASERRVVLKLTYRRHMCPLRAPCFTANFACFVVPPKKIWKGMFRILIHIGKRSTARWRVQCRGMPYAIFQSLLYDISRHGVPSRWGKWNSLAKKKEICFKVSSASQILLLHLHHWSPLHEYTDRLILLYKMRTLGYYNWVISVFLSNHLDTSFCWTASPASNYVKLQNRKQNA